MKRFLNKKIFFSLLLFMFLLIINICPVRAEDIETIETVQPEYYYFNGWNGVPYTVLSLPDAILNYKHYIIIAEKEEDMPLYLFCFNNSLSITHDESFDTYCFDDSITGKMFKYQNNTWEEYGEQGTYSLSAGSMVVNSCIDLLGYSNDFNNPEGFFYKPLPLETQGTLAPVVHKVEMQGVLKEILLIIPLIIVVVVSFLGLRKALKTLFQVLRRS